MCGKERRRDVDSGNETLSSPESCAADKTSKSRKGTGISSKGEKEWKRKQSEEGKKSNFVDVGEEDTNLSQALLSVEATRRGAVGAEEDVKMQDREQRARIRMIGTELSPL